MAYVNNTQFMTGGVSSSEISRQKQGTSLEGASFGDIMAGLMCNSTVDEKAQASNPVESFRNIIKTKIDQVDLDMKAETQKKVEAALDWLSNYLGIPKGLLLSILKDLNIDPKDMADPVKLKEIIKKIASKFKLDEKREKEMTMALEGIFGFVLK